MAGDVAVTRVGRHHVAGCQCRWCTCDGGVKHGDSSAPEYQAWQNMRARCLNPRHPSYKNYGGRGVAVCEQWGSYETFLADVGRRPGPDYSIDRINNDGPYSPENCRWATYGEQRRNMRQTRLLTFNGKTQCLTDWAAEIGLSLDGLRHRLKLGWPIEEVLTRPAGRWAR